MRVLKALWALLVKFFGEVGCYIDQANKQADKKHLQEYLFTFYKNFYDVWGTILLESVKNISTISGLRKPQNVQGVKCNDPDRLPIRMLPNNRPCMEYRLWRTVPFKEESASDLEYVLREELKNICGFHGYPILTAKVIIDPRSNGKMVRVFLAEKGGGRQ